MGLFAGARHACTNLHNSEHRTRPAPAKTPDNGLPISRMSCTPRRGRILIRSRFNVKKEQMVGGTRIELVTPTMSR